MGLFDKKLTVSLFCCIHAVRGQLKSFFTSNQSVCTFFNGCNTPLTPILNNFHKLGLEFIPIRGNRSQRFYKIGILINFRTFIGEHLYRSLFLIKLQVIKKETPLQVFRSAAYKRLFSEHVRTTCSNQRFL